MKIEANGLSFNVEVAGDGDAVLLLHGFPDRARMWRYQIPALVEAGYRVIAPDLRGFGDSDKPDGVENYSILYILEDLKGILDALDVDKAHVVGHDWGAATAWVFASLCPERVRSVTALSVGHPGGFTSAGLEQLQRSWYMFMFQFEGIAEEWIARNDFEFLRQWVSSNHDLDQQISDLARPGALTAGLNWYRANLPPESWIAEPIALPPIAAPAFGIWSTGDDALGEDQMQASQKFVTGEWRYERIEDASHWIPVDAPDRLNELLVDFLSSV